MPRTRITFEVISRLGSARAEVEREALVDWAADGVPADAEPAASETGATPNNVTAISPVRILRMNSSLVLVMST